MSLKLKFKKCNHITDRIYPEIDGNECSTCGWDKYSSRPDTIAYHNTIKMIGYARYSHWMRKIIADYQYKKDRYIVPKHRFNILGISLTPLGKIVPDSSGNFKIDYETNTYYMEQI